MSWPRLLAWSVVILAVVASVLSVTIALVFPGVPTDLRPPRTLAFGALALGVAVPGALILARYPRNRVAWLMCGATVVGAIEHANATYAGAALANDLPLAEASAWVYSWLVNFQFVPLSIMPLFFPDGRLPSPHWRPVLWAAVAGLFAFSGAVAFADIRIPILGIRNPMALAGTDVPWQILAPSVCLLLVAASAMPLSLIWRYRHSGDLVRQQLKWLMYASVIYALALLTGIALGLSIAAYTVITALGLTALMAAVAVAILRHRLYDIDLLINRTLVYGVASAALVGTYAAGVVVFQAVLRPLTDGSELSVAAATLVVVALFQPIRRRVQDAVDRRFYRSRYDAARTLDAFALRLRGEVDIDAVRQDLARTLHETMRPTHASVWLRQGRR